MNSMAGGRVLVAHAVAALASGGRYGDRKGEGDGGNRFIAMRQSIIAKAREQDERSPVRTVKPATRCRVRRP